MFLALLASCASATTAAGSTTTTATIYEANASVVRVVDGDTIDVTVDGREERVRLIGIDTPETVKPNTPVECYGPEASKHTKELLPAGTPVHLERDLVARDDYGRLLSYVFRTDGLFVNRDLIDDGFARPLAIKPNLAYEDVFEQGAHDARAAGLGLWSHCPG
ncbi:MAG: thermonuclease family protein [Ilumatobacteraceae bacterium]